MIALLAGPGVLRAHRRGQRLQHRGHHRRALRRQVPRDDPGTAERGLDRDLAVLERLVRPAIVAAVRERPGVHLRGQLNQAGQVRAGVSRGHQDRIRGQPS